MDSEFEHQMIEMKPMVLRLPHKTERQRCALWIKKLCDSSSSDRKTRNTYSKLLLHMLKRKMLDGPFASKPPTGILHELPSYMSVVLDDSFHGDVTPLDDSILKSGTTAMPDWVQTELRISNGASNSGFHDKDEGLANIYKTSSPKLMRQEDSASDQDDENKRLVYGNRSGRISPISKPWDYVNHEPIKGLSTFRDDQSLIKMHERELEMKTKVLQAQFHEDKLNLQHKHDLAVQKILDRKNSEIEEAKQNFRDREKQLEDNVRVLENRIQSLSTNADDIKELKEKEIDELKVQIDDAKEKMQSDFESKLHDVMAKLERDKYDLQKSHTKNIQELLDDTNRRLAKMEDDYCAQTTATKMVVSELESRVAQLTQEMETSSVAKQALANDKCNLENTVERLQQDLDDTRKRYSNLKKEYDFSKEDHETQIKNMQSKNEANSEFLKQENNMALTKTQETVREFEDQIQNLKHSVQDSEQQRLRELRERESLHQQDLMSVQHLHEKQMHQLRQECEHDKAQHTRDIRNYEDKIRQHEDEITRLNLQHKQNSIQAEQAIEDYRKQVSEAQQKVYNDMQSQLQKVEAELDAARSHKLKIREEANLQLEEVKQKHADEITELRISHEKEKAEVHHLSMQGKDELRRDNERQLQVAEQRLRDAIEEQEKIAEERNCQHQEDVNKLELQARELREELVSTNALRRQQLVELGLLREEERQKAAKENDSNVSRLEAEIDRQRLEMHRQHAAEIERQTQKAKNRVESLESDYKQRLERAYDRISELQNKENALRDELSCLDRESQQRIVDETNKCSREADKIKSHYTAENLNLIAQLEAEREKLHLVERRLQKMEYDRKDDVTKIKMQYEDRMRGMIPGSMKNDLEETISCLRSQVSSLQQRVSVLQDELDDVNHNLMSSSSLKSSHLIAPLNM